MHLSSLIFALITLLATAEAAIKNTTREFHLKTVLKPNQSGKARFNNLWLEAYHTGAGLNDAVMVPNPKAAINGSLNGTTGTFGSTHYQNVIFDLGNEFPWTLDMVANEEFYAGWEPVQVNAGSSTTAQSGFWINATGLQWTNTPHRAPGNQYNIFEGWLVCNWWHGAPQLFFRVQPYDFPAPCSCADVYLMPVYI